ncbi:MAG: aminodeoxychorismate/anthranilate synthase component II [Polyangiaceae bacterium]|nr:aminodeoxychorismate/anthranilate synthase component II [Polyangiaceae bacterium]
MTARTGKTSTRRVRPRVVVIDNYDSFTFNVIELLETLGASCEVFANDAIDVVDLTLRRCDAFVVSPGPCAPDRSGVSLPLYVAALGGHVQRPILGVCLGHQALAAAAGARVTRARRPLHGKTHPIHHDGRGIFRDTPQGFVAARYNSLVVERSTLSADLEISATCAETGEVMGLRHRRLPLESVQFHPESHMSEAGALLLDAWLDDVARAAALGEPSSQRQP